MLQIFNKVFKFGVTFLIIAQMQHHISFPKLYQPILIKPEAFYRIISLTNFNAQFFIH